MLDTFTQPAWIHRVLADLRQAPEVRLVLVILNAAGPETGPPAGVAARLWRGRRHLLYSLYRRLDARLFYAPDSPLLEADATPLVGDCEIMRVMPRMTRNCDYFQEPDLQALRAFDLDVILRFGFRILKGEVLQAARHGVWSYHHGDHHTHRGGPAGFWEVMEGAPLTGSVLQVLSEELDGGRILYDSHASTDPVSVARNVHNYYWKSAAFVRRAIAALHRDGSLPEREGDPGYAPYSRRLYRLPQNGEMLRMGSALFGRYLRRRLAVTGYEQWQLAYHFAPRAAEEGVPHDVLHRYRPLVPPPDRLWADPFPIHREGSYWVFFEEMLRRGGTGYIAALELTPSGAVGQVVRVLERPYHLSYPFLFEWEGDLWMVPESLQNRSVELYRCVRFPDRWELRQTLLRQVRAVDATLVEEGGCWWMFVNLAEKHASTWDELHLFSAETPLGPWLPHPGNPVKSDVRGARPAGGLFRHQGKLYRPGQDCSGEYGRAIVLHQVLRLDGEVYLEKPVCTVEPEWEPRLTGVHTINAWGALSVVDRRVLRPRIPRAR